MSSALQRLSALVSQLGSSKPDRPHVHALTPAIFLQRSASIEPDAIAIHHTTRNGKVIQQTYVELSSRACGLGYYLRDHNLKRVGILAPNTPAFLASIYGISAARGVNVAVNYRLGQRDIAYIFEHAQVEAIIVDAELVHLLDEFEKRHPSVQIIVDDDTHVLTGPDSGQFNRAIESGHALDVNNGGFGWDGLDYLDVNEDDLIALAYTSGTTARPKGVEYTHRGAYLAALANIVESGLNTAYGDRARYLCTLPNFHAMGWTFPWAVTAVRGTHYCLRTIDYAAIWRLLKDESITHFNAAPTVNTLLCDHADAQRLERPVRVTVAASPPSAHLFEKMEELNLMPVHAYGLTETYGPITQGYQLPTWYALPDNHKYALMARQGHGFLTSLPVRVIKTNVGSRVQDVRADGVEIGEIVFCGNICAKGYYRDEAATRKLFAGGVLHSGDLAVRHADGAIEIKDRAKDLIISGGENISSVALEAIMVTHPEILEVACVAVSDAQWGERPKAYITVRSPDSGQALTGEQVVEWTGRHGSISRFMVPREVEIVTELPKTGTGKIQKNVLREWAKGHKM